MLIGNRLRELRVARNLTQRDLEKITGLIYAYISRIENGHTVPTVPTLEKLARAFNVPMYQLFYDDELPSAKKTKTPRLWGSSGKERECLMHFRRHFSRMKEEDRQFLLEVARKLVKQKAARTKENR